MKINKYILNHQLQIMDQKNKLIKDFLKTIKNRKIQPNKKEFDSVFAYFIDEKRINTLLNTVFKNPKLSLELYKYEVPDTNLNTVNDLLVKKYDKLYNIINNVDNAIELLETNEVIQVYKVIYDKKEINKLRSSKNLSYGDGYLSTYFLLSSLEIIDNKLGYILEIEIPKKTNLLYHYSYHEKPIISDFKIQIDTEILLPRGAQLSLVSKDKIQINKTDPSWQDIDHNSKNNMTLLKYKLIGFDKKEVPKTHENMKLKIIEENIDYGNF
jgi:hypothetical protein